MEYDLVVVGSSAAAIEATLKAFLLGARVALVTQCPENTIIRDSRDNFFLFQEATALVDQVKHNPWLLSQDLAPNLSVNVNAVNTINHHHISPRNNSLFQLATLGVDVIWGEGEFCRLPKQAFIVGKRKLRSPKYLIAINSNFKIPSIPGLDLVNSFSYDDVFLQKDLACLGENIAVIGSYAVSLELAQILGKIGKKVTLVVSLPRILPEEELAAIMLIQAQLEADGVDIITNSPVTQIKKISSETWLEAGDKALAIDTILFAEDRELNIDKLNLQGIGVTYKNAEIVVNNKLQTTNKSVYACGDSIGTFSSKNWQQQVDLALKNILLLPWYTKNSYLRHKVVFTEPTLASIGMIESQARAVYGNKIYVIREYFKNLIQSQLVGQNTGWCQLIIDWQGNILGATIIGDRAEELITTIGLMMQHKIRLHKNPIKSMLNTQINTIDSSHSAILNKIALEFHQQKLQRNKKNNSWLKTWLKIKRKLSK